MCLTNYDNSVHIILLKKNKKIGAKNKKAEISKLLTSTELIPCKESIQLWNCFLEASIPREGIEDFGIVVCCVPVGERTPLL
jgi:hypothetical protein